MRNIKTPPQHKKTSENIAFDDPQQSVFDRMNRSNFNPPIYYQQHAYQQFQSIFEKIKNILDPPVDAAEAAKKAKKKGKGQPEEPEFPEEWDGSIQTLQNLLEKVSEVDNSQKNILLQELNVTLDSCITPQNESIVNQRVFGDILMELVDAVSTTADQVKEECIKREEERKLEVVEGEEATEEGKPTKPNKDKSKGQKDQDEQPKYDHHEYLQEFNKNLQLVFGKLVDEVKDRITTNKSMIQQNLDKQINNLELEIDQKNTQDQNTEKLWVIFALLRIKEYLKL
eukprot:TRINITY_DN28005_c0_g1_i1.p2 TRINITY_DN28005_c0_g1~~TRINITY_DN28005_c0_g1_i1.p2  ORF type:complete len:302 (-),score=47.71 TRINITY_DN28005_c0_g1_i1:47-898(-)